jgi:hypothetical protein
MHSKAIKQCHLYGDISGLPLCLKILFLLSLAERTLYSFVVKFAGHSMPSSHHATHLSNMLMKASRTTVMVLCGQQNALSIL